MNSDLIISWLIVNFMGMVRFYGLVIGRSPVRWINLSKFNWGFYHRIEDKISWNSYIFYFDWSCSLVDHKQSDKWLSSLTLHWHRLPSTGRLWLQSQSNQKYFSQNIWEKSVLILSENLHSRLMKSLKIYNFSFRMGDWMNIIKKNSEIEAITFV